MKTLRKLCRKYKQYKRKQERMGKFNTVKLIGQGNKWVALERR